MKHRRSDEIAREAARLFDRGQAGTIPEAIQRAKQRLNAFDAPAPSHGRVREHLRGLAMESLGAEGYADHVRAVLASAEQVMAVLEAHDPLLVGRAAKGHIDGGVVLHIRVYTDASIEELVEMLEAAEYAVERVETVNTRFGRLNRLCFETDGRSVVVMRCLPEMAKDRAVDLFNERRIAICSLEALRDRLGA